MLIVRIVVRCEGIKLGNRRQSGCHKGRTPGLYARGNNAKAIRCRNTAIPAQLIIKSPDLRRLGVSMSTHVPDLLLLGAHDI